MATEYVSYADDTPMMVVTSVEPLTITRGTPIERPEEGPFPGAGIVDRFTHIGKRPTAIVERLRCRMPRPSEAERLKLRSGIPVVVITRTSYAGEKPDRDRRHSPGC
jgi:GntR family transcriptional regulator